MSNVNTTTGSPPATEARPAGRSHWWIFFAVLCLLQLAAWVAWLMVASRHPVAEVPLATPAHH